MAYKIRRTFALLGPAFVAAVAYVDPGNFAANFSAGSQYGYQLLWVLVLANIMASLVQYLSAKVGLVTGKSLPEIVAERLGRNARIAYWLQAELVAIATDIAEVIGGAIALDILFGVPLLAGAIITGLVSLLLLVVYSRRGQKIFERVIVGLLLIIPIGFIYGLFVQPPNAGAILAGLVPNFGDKNMIFLATAMLGATVMPHVVYLHSAMARDRHGKVEAHRLAELLRATKIDVGIAMVLAGGVNISMLLLAASALGGVSATDSLPAIFVALESHVAPIVGWLFGISLLVSGFASTAVGAHAGSIIMEGMLNQRISVLLRRIIAIIPAIVIVMLGINPTLALIISQVALSFGIPFALVPLIMATRSRRIMGEQANGRSLTVILSSVVAVIVVLNAVLIVFSIFG